MKKSLFILLSLMVCYEVYAQPLTLKDAVNLALQNNKKVKQFTEKYEQKKFEDLGSWGNFLPKINVTGGYTHLNDPLEIDLSPIRDVILNLQAKIDSVLPQRAFKMNFITNHDENSWNGTAKEKFGKGEKSCAVLTYTLPGMPLIYNGQEAGMTKRLRFFAKDTINWSDTLMITFYKTMNSLKHRNPALWNPPYGGKLIPLTNSAPGKIVSFLRSSGNSHVMVLINMSPDTITTKITTDIADGKYINTFNQNKINFNVDNRKCYFEPWEYLVLEGE